MQFSLCFPGETCRKYYAQKVVNDGSPFFAFLCCSKTTINVWFLTSSGSKFLKTVMHSFNKPAVIWFSLIFVLSLFFYSAPNAVNVPCFHHHTLLHKHPSIFFFLLESLIRGCRQQPVYFLSHTTDHFSNVEYSLSSFSAFLQRCPL